MTLPRTKRVSAPGKVMIAGEYAVLEGRDALVAAVSARAVVYASHPTSSGSNGAPGGSRESSTLPPEAVLAQRHAEKVVGTTAKDLVLDVTALQYEGRKLGLGSSAAGSVACAAAVLSEHGVDVESAEGRAQVMECALAGHRAVAPEGSGADVAASVWGGFLRFRRESDGFVDVAAVRFPAHVSAVLVWTGMPARTSDLVRAVRVAAEKEPVAYRHAIDAIDEASRGMRDAIERENTGALIESTHAHHRAMDALGAAAHAPIVDARLAQVSELARRLGGAAKPSGAGGGDVSIAFLPDSSYASEFAEECASAGMRPLPFKLGDGGVRREYEDPARGDLDEGMHR